MAAAPAAAGRGRTAGSGAGQLADAEQERVVLDVVCREAAGVLGHDSAAAVRPGAVFRDLGFDSLTAVEFRNRVATATGLSLPATLVFDYPTPRVLAGWLRGEVTGARAVGPAVAAPVVVAGDPVAVVAMGCRFPGGVVQPGGPVGAGQVRHRRDLGIPAGPGLAGPGRGPAAGSPCGRAGSSMRRPGSTPGSSGSARVRRWRWTRSSGCCLRCAGRRSSGPGSTQLACGVRGPACSPGSPARTTPDCWPWPPTTPRAT